jgi:hypothetical protein
MSVNKPDVQYVSKRCPTCGNHQKHDPLPLYIILGVLGLFLILFIVIYVKYLLVKRGESVCMSLRKGEQQYTSTLKDIL